MTQQINNCLFDLTILDNLLDIRWHVAEYSFSGRSPTATLWLRRLSPTWDERKPKTARIPTLAACLAGMPAPVGMTGDGCRVPATPHEYTRTPLGSLSKGF